MDFLNIGTGELAFLLLLAILVVGPRRAVELLQQGGRLLVRLRREWRSVQRDVLTEVNALKDDALGETGTGLQKEWQRIQQDIKTEIQEVQDEARIQEEALSLLYAEQQPEEEGSE